MEYKDREDVVPFTGEKKGVCVLLTAVNIRSTESHPSVDIYYLKIIF